jgi:hypothetical protein
MTRDVGSAAGRPAGDYEYGDKDVPITSKMIEAGVSAYYAVDCRVADVDCVVAEVYYAMAGSCKSTSKKSCW